MSSKKTRNIIFNLSLILVFTLVGIIICLCLLEFTLRSDTLREKLLPKSRITKNINTFNNIREDIARHLKDRKKTKILILGDSFIRNGHMVDKKIKELLEDKNVSILNLAYSGYSPLEYFAAFSNFGRKYKPDIVIISYYVGNDLTDTKYLYKGIEARIENARLIPPHRLESHADNTSLYFKNFLRQSYNNLLKRQKNIKYWQENGVRNDVIEIYKEKGMSPWMINLGLQHQNFFLSNLMFKDKSDYDAWLTNKSILSKIHKMATGLGSKTLIAIFPHSLQVNKHHYSLFKKLNIITDQTMLSTQVPQDLLMDFCKESKIDCLDLLPFYRAKKNMIFFWDYDDHMNGEGQKLAGKLIADFISSLK